MGPGLLSPVLTIAGKIWFRLGHGNMVVGIRNSLQLGLPLTRRINDYS
jgi:hypothetical protein